MTPSRITVARDVLVNAVASIKNQKYRIARSSACSMLAASLLKLARNLNIWGQTAKKTLFSKPERNPAILSLSCKFGIIFNSDSE